MYDHPHGDLAITDANDLESKFWTDTPIPMKVLNSTDDTVCETCPQGSVPNQVLFIGVTIVHKVHHCSQG